MSGGGRKKNRAVNLSYALFHSFTLVQRIGPSALARTSRGDGIRVQ